MPELGSIFVRIGAKIEDFETGLAKAGKALNTWGRSVSKLGGDITRSIGLPLAGIATAAFKFSEDASASFKSFGEATKASFGVLGDAIAKAINLPTFLHRVSAGVSDLVHIFVDLSPETQRVVAGIAAFTIALGPALLILGKLISTFGLLLAHPIVALIALLGAAAAGWYAYSLSVKDAENKTKSFATATNEYIEQRLKSKVKPMGLAQELAFATLGIKKGMSTPVGKPTFVGPPDQRKNIEADLQKKKEEEDLNRITEIGHRTIDQNRMIDATEAELGDRYDENAAKAEVYRKATIDYHKLDIEGNVYAADAAEESSKMTASMTEKIGQGITAWGAFRNEMDKIPPVTVAIGQGIFGIFEELSQGIGNSIAQILVYGGTVADVFKALGKQILATIISTLIKIGIQQLILAAVSTSAAALVGASFIAVSTARAGVAAYAASIESEGLLGLATGVGAALEAIATAGSIAEIGSLAGAAFGAAAAVPVATGGLTLGPTLLLAGEGGEQEMIAPLSEAKKMLGTNNRSQRVVVQIGSRSVVDAVVEGFPNELKLRGIY